MLELQDKAQTVRLPSFKLTPNSIFEPHPKKRDDQAQTGGKSLLDQIQIPCDLKRLRIFQLPALAAEIRQFIIETVAKTGGHLASNLGTIELRREI